MSTVKRPTDPRYKTTLSMALHRARLQFHVAQDLFSSTGLDPGTAALLRTLAGPDHSRAGRILDLGCGYGPLGLFLKAWEPERTLHLIDRDGLAVEYAQMNADLNGLAGVAAYPSLGYDDVTERDFDLVVSNVPAKAGPRAIESLLLDANHFLARGGMVAVVVIDRIAPDARAILIAAGVDVILEGTNRGYTWFHYRFPGAPPAPYESAFARGVYDRGRLRHGTIEITTVFGLPEFDTPGFAAQLAIRLLGSVRGHPVVLNPGQGLIPAAVGRPVTLDDRDLLAVRNSARNAAVAAAAEPDAVIALLRQGESMDVTLEALGRYDAGSLLLAGTSTQVTRLVEALRGEVTERKRNKGFSAAIINR